MYQGTIVRLTDKGFGFVSIDGMEKDIFFHASALTNKHFNDLREGEAIMCEYEENEKGLTAIKVEVIEGEQAPAEGEMPVEETPTEEEAAPMAE